MKLELIIEAHISLQQALTVRSQQQPIEQLARLRHGSEIRDATRETTAVPNDTTQVTLLIPGELVIDERPCGLTFDTPCITRKTNHIEGFHRFADPLAPVEVAQMHICRERTQEWPDPLLLRQWRGCTVSKGPVCSRQTT
ncbi:hypothetical protein [Pseudomonas arcuscaelestis]|uniref:hypothetical protein n=1 Tax=Pseudomonas arcuscaelestis TaxID=2710591 RepID=UPI00193D2191|nr:hypothetical protein [Pseudomonas arcuscaelestis]